MTKYKGVRWDRWWTLRGNFQIDMQEESCIVKIYHRKVEEYNLQARQILIKLYKAHSHCNLINKVIAAKIVEALFILAGEDG